MAKQNHNPDSSRKQSPKLTSAQLKVLRYLRDGDAIYRGWMQDYRKWHVHGPWGKDSVTDKTITILNKAGLTELDRDGDNWFIRITDLGRSALRAADAESSAAPQDGEA